MSPRAYVTFQTAHVLPLLGDTDCIRAAVQPAVRKAPRRTTLTPSPEAPPIRASSGAVIPHQHDIGFPQHCRPPSHVSDAYRARGPSSQRLEAAEFIPRVEQGVAYSFPYAMSSGRISTGGMNWHGTGKFGSDITEV